VKRPVFAGSLGKAAAPDFSVAVFVVIEPLTTRINFFLCFHLSKIAEILFSQNKLNKLFLFP
jgi:hypothetical protein